MGRLRGRDRRMARYALVLTAVIGIMVFGASYGLTKIMAEEPFGVDEEEDGETALPLFNSASPASPASQRSEEPATLPSSNYEDPARKTVRVVVILDDKNVELTTRMVSVAQ